MWKAYVSAPIHAAQKENFDNHEARFNTRVSPYTVKTVGTRPANGWALFIAMHGGGGTTQEFNHSQVAEHDKLLPRPPRCRRLQYVALRAPNNEWNGFYTSYVYPLIGNLVRDFLLFGDVDPDKVFLMGYSHGGYGAFAIGPKMPDRFAAIHASAAALADDARPDTLRNTVFTCMVGENDTAHGRIARDREFGDDIQRLRGTRTGHFSRDDFHHRQPSAFGPARSGQDRRDVPSRAQSRPRRANLADDRRRDPRFLLAGGRGAEKGAGD